MFRMLNLSLDFQIFKQRKSHIIPYYSACWVLVENPGDINNPNQRAKLEELIESFEALPSANGRYSTKFWLRDYEDFLKQSEEIDLPMEEEEDEELAIQFTVNGSQVVTPSQPFGQGNELRQFLEWPEFSFWKGFIQVGELKFVKKLECLWIMGSQNLIVSPEKLSRRP